MKFIPVLLWFCLTSCILNAQVPATDLFLFQLTEDTLGSFHIHSPKYFSNFNPGGYTNQPFFISEEELFVSVRYSGETQNDIYSIDLRRETIRQVTDTPQSEFSPTRIFDSEYFACVRQTATGENIQNLVLYPLDQSTNGKLLIDDAENIGYFCFLDPKKVALFLVDEPNKLAIADTETGELSFLSSNIGRCLRRYPDGSMIYVHKYADDFWYLKLYDINNRKASIIERTLPGAEDFCVNEMGQIFMGDGPKLFMHNGSENSQWQLVGDLSIFGIENISRLAINNNNQIAIINSSD